ncbi:MAG: hypothetical protein RLZZ546_1408 [Bacteroidota bacterium]|jgi:hypothetical protein
MSIEIERIETLQMELLNEIINEALILDETTPYESKRKIKKS